MAKVRQDAWSHEDDLLLAETVLRHIREGSTQLDAFEEVGDRLNRTGAACGFRWNAIVRRKYESAIEIAKKQRKQLKRAEQRMSRGYQPRSTYLTNNIPATADVEISTDFNEQEVPVETHVDYTTEQDRQQPIQRQLSMKQVISFLQNLQVSTQSNSRLERENQTLKEQNEALTHKVTELEKVIAKLKKEHITIEEDYQSLIDIMERARRMVMIQDQDDKGATFKMDKNGNLEKLAK